MVASSGTAGLERTLQVMFTICRSGKVGWGGVHEGKDREVKNGMGPEIVG